MYTYMYIYIYIHSYLYPSSICIYMYIYIYIHIIGELHSSLRLVIDITFWALIYVYVYVHIYLFICISFKYMYIYVYVYKYIYMYIYIYIYTNMIGELHSSLRLVIDIIFWVLMTVIVQVFIQINLVSFFLPFVTIALAASFAVAGLVGQVSISIAYVFFMMPYETGLNSYMNTYICINMYIYEYLIA
jgi:hypothetical protein